MFGALFCTVAVKFYHALRNGLVGEYLGWIPADIAFLLALEVIFSVVCFRWRLRWVVRTVTVAAAIVCTWSVMNAAWLIRTGTQILPTVLLPLIRDPLNTLGIVGVNLVKMPVTSVILFGPSALALAFFFSVLVRPILPSYRKKLFRGRIALCVLIVGVAIVARALVAERRSPQVAAASLRYNCHVRAILSIVFHYPGRPTRSDLDRATRRIPTFDQIDIPIAPDRQPNHNLVVVVLEGIQYRYTSLSDNSNGLTPALAAIAEQGVEFSNTRSCLTHTTKALFASLTGRYPSVSHDIVEAVPVVRPYASIATILKRQLDFRTAFFQSAKGSFEARPALVYNLGFDKFWARETLDDPNTFIGYLGSDEFSMLEPIAEWIRAEKTPFLLLVLCSVTHDPHEVPKWFATPAREPIECYKQSISYTDEFISALDRELAKLNSSEDTIFCVIGDHGEAFGEHGQWGHERIAFDEVLHVPFVLRGPDLVGRGTKVCQPVSNVDLTPTLLALLGFEIADANFDGIDVLADIPHQRKVYFSGWMGTSPAGFVQGDQKYVYIPGEEKVLVYDLRIDPDELNRTELDAAQGDEIVEQIISWRRDSIFRPDQHRTGRQMLFGQWQCRWNGRTCLAKHCPEANN
ncbi:MAG: LTA synthase family protein [Planctomycetota bacterium]|jgi:phosphoglycerol transferase MdoB-like AlkP superfamily enzyme